MRTPEKTKEALGGPYPAASLYMQVRLARRPQGRGAEARQCLRQDAELHQHPFGRRDRRQDAEGLSTPATRISTSRRSADGKAMFTPDGRMPADGPTTVLEVLSDILQEPQGQADRPVEDLHDGVRRRRQVASRPRASVSESPVKNKGLRRSLESNRQRGPCQTTRRPAAARGSLAPLRQELPCNCNPWRPRGCLRPRHRPIERSPLTT